ncbi:Transglycosylase [Pseudobacteriovorax antillogorgiicola]|uniref:Transglycosylase n=1 Tax=Pseudobacteriovorax antillogorgiicola TaxID=1513793 RepID=A0A1Y6CCD3_9BACT|nr:transglycosylase [Pseudobacteriovorax antillogorgiicola]SMF55690.1 Transglycosylase [Pseudobacteriovorax antillogorgiicola]
MFKITAKRVIVIILGALLAIPILLMPPVWQLKSGPVDVTRWPKTGEQTFSIGPQWKHWVPIKSVSWHVLHAIMVAEDARFLDHMGIDPTAIYNSLKLNLEKGRYVRGASTISQQVVKMTLLSPEKTLLRKFREILGALLMEQLLSKEEILEWYINLTEFGDGVFGIKDAAFHYFDTSPELLTIQQGANLALVLPSPNAWSVGLRSRKLTAFGHRRYAHIIEMMFQQGFINEPLRKAALATGDFGRPIDPNMPDEGDEQIPADETEEAP